MTPDTQNSRFRYRIFTMVVLLALINYIDRGAMSYAAAHITGEYGLDRGDWGSVPVSYTHLTLPTIYSV